MTAKPPRSAGPSPAAPPPPARNWGWILSGAMALVIGFGMLVVGLYHTLQPAPITPTRSPPLPGGKPANQAMGPGEHPQLYSPAPDNHPPGGTAPTPPASGQGAEPVQVELPPTPAQELRTWPGRLAIFSDTPFSDGRPMDLIQPVEWQPVLSLKDRGLTPPNPLARPEIVDLATKRGLALPPDLRLYLSFNGAGAIIAAEVRGGRLALLYSAAPDQPMAAFASGELLPVAPDLKGVGRTILRFQLRDGQLAVLQDGRNLCSAKAPAGFTSAMAWQTGPESTTVFGDFELLNAGDILFRDDFMRAGSDGFWKPLAGAWELEALTFPERSSNPFALKAIFSDRTELADLDKDRELFPGEDEKGEGAGIQLSVHDNRITVARITGDGAAARAGLMEEDVILALNGRTLSFRDMMFFYREIRRPSTGTVDLEILRPGEARSRHIVFTPGVFHWADVRLHERLPGSQQAATALIAAGQDSWRQYHAQVALRFLSAGGAGLVLGAGKAGAIAIRWYGLNVQDSKLPANRFEVVRVAAENEQVLYQRPLTPWRDTFYRLHADTTGPDLKIYVDDVLITELKGVEPPAGPIGLWAAKGNLPGVSPADDGVYFDDVEVVSDAAQLTNKAQMRVNRIMKNEQDMKQWANPSHEWMATARLLASANGKTPGALVVQYRNDIPGHQSLAVKTPQPAAGHGFSLYLGVPLPVANVGRIPAAMTPAEDAGRPHSPRSVLAMDPAGQPADLAALGAPVFAPPGLAESPPPLSLEEKRRDQVYQEGPTDAAGQAPGAALPPVEGAALECRFAPAANGTWHWEVLSADRAGKPEVTAGAPLAHGDCAALPDAVALVSLPGKVVLRINGQDAAILPQDLVAPVGQSVAVSGLDNWPDDGVLTATGDQVLEYTFNNAPDDWAVHAGRWGLLNKWVCDPRWSWFGGRSDDGLASIWQKTKFEGDIAVDYYAALMMYQNDPPYERPGDFNCTICGDGQSMGSGYSLIFGGGDNRWSALTKGGRTVAWSLFEGARLPSDRLRQQEKMALHQRWFHLQLRRVGATVSYSLDGTQWLTFNDPQPLASGRVALWTRNNGFLLARVRIAYQKSLGPVLDEGRTAPHMAENQAAAGAPADPANARPVQHRFDVDPTPLGHEWTARCRWESVPPRMEREAQPAPLHLLPPGQVELRRLQAVPGIGIPAWPDEALAVTSPGEGSCAVGIKPARPFSFDPGHSRVRFWFKADSEVSVDLYFRTQKDNYFRVRLTGPAEGPPGTLELGDAGENLNDGKWHLIELDLLARYEALLRDRYIQLRVTQLDILIGGLSPCDGQLWNVGVNPPGGGYQLADFEVLPAANRDLPVQTAGVAAESELRPLAQDLFALPLSAKPGAVLRIAVATRADSETQELEVGAGNAIQRNADGVDYSLHLLALRPWLKDPAELKNLKLRWQTGAVPTELTETVVACKLPADPAFRWRGLRLTPVLWTTRKSGPVPAWFDAQPVNVDFGRVASDETLATSPQPRNALICRPGAPALANPFTGLAALRVAPREAGKNWGLSVPLLADQVGMQSQAATPRTGKLFRVIPGMDPVPLDGDTTPAAGSDNQAFSLARYPLLRIDHRTPFEAPVNLRAWTNEGSVSFELTDHWAPFTWYLDDPSDFLGADHFTADGRWRSELVDLRAIWQRDRFVAGEDNDLPWLQNLQLVDNGWPGARKGMFLDYGRVQAVPACRPDEFGVRLSDLPPGSLDAQGKLAQGLQLILTPAAPGQDIAAWIALASTDRNNEKQPVPNVLTVAAADREKLTSGMYWIYALDAAAWQALIADHDDPGKRMAPPRIPAYFDACPVLIDGAPPAARDISPAPAATPPNLGVTQIQFRLADDNFLLRDSVRLKVLDTSLSLGDPAIHFDPTDNRVTIDLVRLWSRAGMPAAPTTVGVTLLAAADALGNRLEEPVAITAFTFDPAQKQPAPTLAQWRCSNFSDDRRSPTQDYRALLHDPGFNRYELLPGDGDFRGAGTAITLTTDRPAWGEKSLRATVVDPLGEFFTTLYEDPWFVDDRPVLLFDYRATTDAHLQLECDIDDRHAVIPLEGPAGQLLADGEWHHVGIDLGAYLRTRFPDLKYYLARKLRVVEARPRTMLAGAGVDIDNLALLDGPRPMLLQLHWQTADGAPSARVLADVDNLTQGTPTTPLANRPANGRDVLDVPYPQTDPLYAHLQAVARNGATSPVIHLKLWDLHLPIRRARELHWLER